MPDSSLTPDQEAALRELGAVVLDQQDGGGVLAADQRLQKWRIAGDGVHSPEGEPPSLKLSDDFDNGYALGEPVDLTNVIKELRRPMTPGAVRWKVQATLGPKDKPHSGLIVPYIDARLVGERLNTVCPGAWTEEFEMVDWGSGRGAMLCRLTIGDVTRRDVGAGNYDAKGLVSDAFKRAAVKFGIGVFLYAQPKVTFKVESGLIWLARGKENSKVARLTDRGEQWLPLLYTRWLVEHGVQAFGAPLDHGDSIAAGGDVESLDPEAVGEEGLEEVEPGPPTEEQKQLNELSASVTKKGGKK